MSDIKFYLDQDYSRNHKDISNYSDTIFSLTAIRNGVEIKRVEFIKSDLEDHENQVIYLHKFSSGIINLTGFEGEKMQISKEHCAIITSKALELNINKY